MLRYFTCSQYKSKDRPTVIISDMHISEDELMPKMEKYFYEHIADMMPGSVREITYKEFIDDPNCFTYNYL